MLADANGSSAIHRHEIACRQQDFPFPMESDMSSMRSLLVAGLLAFPVDAQADLVTNGSFEVPGAAPGGFVLHGIGSSFGGWTVVGSAGNVAVISNTYSEAGVLFSAHQGDNWLDLTGNGVYGQTGVRQTIATVAVQTYDVSFHIGNVVTPGIADRVLTRGSTGGARQHPDSTLPGRLVNANDSY